MVLYVINFILVSNWSDKGYINNVKVVSSNKGSSPENVLEWAKSFIKKDGYDQAFCVFDKDKHSTYSSVVNNIKNIRYISSINSEPCFE